MSDVHSRYDSGDFDKTILILAGVVVAFMALRFWIFPNGFFGRGEAVHAAPLHSPPSSPRVVGTDASDSEGDEANPNTTEPMQEAVRVLSAQVASLIEAQERQVAALVDAT